jgi:raffinose/stachyose/melibiose transport system permease protein
MTVQNEKKRYLNVGRVIMTLILIIVAVIQIFPFYWMISFSFKNNNDIYGGNIAGLPTVFHIENYIKAFKTGNIGIYLMNSVIVTIVTVVFVALLACMAAYAMLRMEWRLKGFFFGFFLIGYMIPMHATLLPLMKLLGNMGLLDSRLALILPYIAFGLPFAIYILSGFMRDIPGVLEEAACIDGANIYQIYFRIIFPLLKPAISTIAIFTFLSSWNELMFSMTFVNDPLKKTLTYGIMSFEGQYAVDWGVVGAGLSIATIPVLILYLIFAESFQKGIVAGAVKG